MPQFSYLGLDASGQERKGTIEAENEKEVVRILRERSIFVLKVRRGASLQGSRLAASLRGVRRFSKPSQHMPVSSTDLVMFFRQTALMLRAGYTLVTALEANHDMVNKLRLRRAIGRMTDDIRRGANFSSLMKEERKIFSPMVANLIASGEQSGNLDTILDRLADGLERTRDIKLQLISALIYPSVVLLVSLVVMVFLVYGVIPRFATFLTARNAELPASTQLLMDVSRYAQDYGPSLAIILGLSAFGVLAAYTTRGGKRVIDHVILAVPVIGNAVLFAAMAQAGWSFSMLLKSGVSALGALRIVSGITGNLAIGDCFRRAADDLLEGRALSKAFNQPYITQMMQHMAAVGESSGELDTVMGGVGEYYQKELATKVKMIAFMIEPMLILFVGGLVFFVYIAFFKAVMAVSKGGM